MTQAARRDQVAELRARLSDPGRVARGLGLFKGARYERGGVAVLCPAHQENTPSCSLTKGPDGTLRVRCFGCDLAGDLFTLIAAKLGLDTERDFPRLVQEAADLAGVYLDRDVGSPPPAKPKLVVVPPPPSGMPTPPTATEQRFDKAARTLLELCPLEGSVAVGLASRGVLAEAQADGWGELPANVRLEGAEASRAAASGFDTSNEGATELLKAIGASGQVGALRWVLRGTSLDRPEHRLLIPWRGPGGRVWTVQRRYAPRYGDETPPKGTPKYVFPDNQRHAPTTSYAYGVDHVDVEQADEVWVVEGAVDVLAVRALNRAAPQPRRLVALGIPGVQGWSRVAASVLPWCKGRLVRVALDRDEAGERAVDGMLEACYLAGAREVRRTAPREPYKDWGDYAAAKLWRGKARA